MIYGGGNSNYPCQTTVVDGQRPTKHFRIPHIIFYFKNRAKIQIISSQHKKISNLFYYPQPSYDL